ncbi:hypothetical protein FB451DRAFT_1549299 [Mycena latifolia]|nr:hypothetical protein FB451DRAFT_1549299 [Mycena latifolia]
MVRRRGHYLVLRTDARTSSCSRALEPRTRRLSLFTSSSVESEVLSFCHESACSLSPAQHRPRVLTPRMCLHAHHLCDPATWTFRALVEVRPLEYDWEGEFERYLKSRIIYTQSIPRLIDTPPSLMLRCPSAAPRVALPTTLYIASLSRTHHPPAFGRATAVLRSAARGKEARSRKVAFVVTARRRAPNYLPRCARAPSSAPHLDFTEAHAAAKAPWRIEKRASGRARAPSRIPVLLIWSAARAGGRGGGEGGAGGYRGAPWEGRERPAVLLCPDKEGERTCCIYATAPVITCTGPTESRRAAIWMFVCKDDRRAACCVLCASRLSPAVMHAYRVSILHVDSTHAPSIHRPARAPAPLDPTFHRPVFRYACLSPVERMLVHRPTGSTSETARGRPHEQRKDGDGWGMWVDRERREAGNPPNGV